MSESSPKHPDLALTRCVVDGCDYSVRYLHEIPNGYRLTCGEHKGENAIDLAEFDFRPLYEDNSRYNDRPELINRLQTVSSVLEAGVKPRGKGGRLSVIARESDSNEIKYETRSYPGSGVYAFVRLESSTPDWYEEQEYDGREQVPEWGEWVFCDPPIDHIVDKAKCSECGETNTVIGRSSPRFTTGLCWDRLHHHGECPHASDEDTRLWREQQYAKSLYERPEPGVMALECIYDEINQLRKHFIEDDTGASTQAYRSRLATLGDALECRLDGRFPVCPECGSELEYAAEYIVECSASSCEIPPSVSEEFGKQKRRVWGWRGHGDKSPILEEDHWP